MECSDDDLASHGRDSEIDGGETINDSLVSREQQHDLDPDIEEALRCLDGAVAAVKASGSFCEYGYSDKLRGAILDHISCASSLLGRAGADPDAPRNMVGLSNTMSFLKGEGYWIRWLKWLIVVSWFCHHTSAQQIAKGTHT